MGTFFPKSTHIMQDLRPQLEEAQGAWRKRRVMYLYLFAVFVLAECQSVLDVD